MPTRLERVDQTIQEYEQTGVPLIYFDGEELGPVGNVDGAGIRVLPYRSYILNYIALSLFYGLGSLNEPEEQGALSRIKTVLQSWSQKI